MEFRQVLADLMEERGWTNYRLAKLLDCSQSTVSNWINGETMPQKKTLMRIADVFHVTVEELQGQKKPAAQGGELDDLNAILRRLSPQNLAVVGATAKALLSAQADQDSHG